MIVLRCMPAMVICNRWVAQLRILAEESLILGELIEIATWRLCCWPLRCWDSRRLPLAGRTGAGRRALAAAGSRASDQCAERADLQRICRTNICPRHGGDQGRIDGYMERRTFQVGSEVKAGEPVAGSNLARETRRRALTPAVILSIALSSTEDMVERGHNDRVGRDRLVAYEYGKWPGSTPSSTCRSEPKSNTSTVAGQTWTIPMLLQLSQPRFERLEHRLPGVPRRPSWLVRLREEFEDHLYRPSDLPR
jgi:hypothetical protein